MGIRSRRTRGTEAAGNRCQGSVRFALGALAVVSLLAAAVPAGVAGSASPRPQAQAQAAAACSQWDITGTWQTLQSNVYSASWAFSQQGTNISGSATIPPAEAQRQRFTGNTGQVSGSLVGDRLDVVVQWPVRTDGVVVRGRYVGTVAEAAAAGQGQVSDGQAGDVANPSGVSWTGTGSARCVTPTAGGPSGGGQPGAQGGPPGSPQVIMVGPEGLPLGPLPAKPPFVREGQQPCPPDCGPRALMPIGGYRSLPGKPAAPGETPFTPAQQKELNAIKKRLNPLIGATALFGGGVTLVGTATAPFAPHAGVLLRLAGGGVALVAGASKMLVDFVDPFDPEYRVIAEPSPRGPHVTAPGRAARHANALSDNSVQLRDVTLALLTAINRAQSAKQEGDDAARVAQLRAAARFARSGATLAASRAALRRRLAAALPRVVLSPRRLRSTQRKLARDGLPGESAAVLQGFGAPEAWVGEYGKALAGMRVRRTVDVRQQLRDRSLTVQEQTTALFFRRLAQFLQPPGAV